MKVEQLKEALVRDRREQRDDNLKQFWQHIGMAIPERPLQSLYSHVRRMYHPNNYQAWTPADDEKLAAYARLASLQSVAGLARRRLTMAPPCTLRARRHWHSLVAEEGHRWRDIAAKMGRMAGNCRDRWREISVKRKNSGPLRVPMARGLSL